MSEAPGAVIEGSAEEVPQDQPEPEPSTEIVLAPPGAGAIIAAEQPEEILAKAAQIAGPLAKLIEDAGLSKALGGRNGRKHVEVGGWQAAGTMLGALGGQALHAETVWTRRVLDGQGQPERTRYTAEVKRYFKKADGGGIRETVSYDVDGFSWEACVEIRTASAIVVGRAEAMCSRQEETWNQRDDYAVRSMAETRAESRAYRRAIGWIVHLAGYNPTPAEEMGHTPGAEQAAELPGWALEAAPERKKLAHASVAFLLADLQGNAPAGATEVLKGIREAVGAPMPEVLATALSRVAKAAQDAQAKRQRGQPSGADPDDGPPPEDGAGDHTGPTTFDPVSQTAQPATPAPGTIDAELNVEMTAEQQEARLRERGCVCDNPLSEVKFANDHCPIKGHGIPF